MAHVIDSFVVELGLDATKFNAQQKAAVAAAKRGVDEHRREAAELERRANAVGDTIAGVTRRAIGLFGVLVGARGFVDFAAGAVQAGSELGRLSRAIGVSANDISKWQGAAREFGSTGEAMASSFKQISNVFTAWQVGGPEAPGIMQIFRVINTEAERLDKNNAKIVDGNKGVAASYLALADNLKIIHDLSKDANLASYLAGKVPGMDAGMFDMLIQGGDKMAEMLKRINGMTNANADSAGRLQRRWEALKVATETKAQGWLFNAIDFLGDSPKWFGSAFGGGGASVGETIDKKMGRSENVAFSGGFSTAADREQYIRQQAVKRGINPDVAMKVARSEGFNSFQSSVPSARGPNGREDSWGAFQLYMGGGLGNAFQKATGLDPRNRANEAATIDFALDDVTKNGWKAFHGAKNTGIGRWDGVGQGGGNSSSTSSVTNFNAPITIQSGPNASAGDIAAKLRDLGMKRQQEGNQSPVGGE